MKKQIQPIIIMMNILKIIFTPMNIFAKVCNGTHSPQWRAEIITQNIILAMSLITRIYS